MVYDPLRLQQKVLAWLESSQYELDSPGHCAAITESSRKRARRHPTDSETDAHAAADLSHRPPKRHRRRRLPTPPSSSGNAMSESLPPPKTKRALADDADASEASSSSYDALSSCRDNDQTPKGKKTKPLPPWGYPPSSTASSSRQSGSVSARKRIRNTATISACSQQFSMQEDIPSSLMAMWKDMDLYSRGFGVVGLSEKDAVERAKREVSDFIYDNVGDFVYEPEPSDPAGNGIGKRARLGPTPSVAAVMDILERGRGCRNQHYDEAGWNQVVHAPLLSLAFDSLWRDGDNAVAFVPCTSAAIITNYADYGGGRKVDFCVCIRPDAQAARAIQAIRTQDRLASLSINHTDFPPLQNKPLALSVETKIQGEGLGSAEAQLVTWHVAQWRLLDRLASRAGPESDATTLPAFLPGIIVQGHDWSFVASTRRDDRVTLWTSQHIGSTAKATGVYQIVCALQYLRAWIEESYWPWYREAILCLPAEDS